MKNTYAVSQRLRPVPCGCCCCWKNNNKAMLLVGLFFLFSALSTLSTSDTSDTSTSLWPCEDEELDCALRASRGNCYGLSSSAGNETQGQQGQVPGPGQGRRLDPFLGIKTITTCRKSCRDHYKEHFHRLDKAVHLFVELCGGMEDRVRDTFGYEHDICDESQAFVGERRQAFLHSSYRAKTIMRKIVKAQRQYSEQGLKLSTVPKSLFGDIMDFYKTRKRVSYKPWKKETCDPAHMPCWEVVDDGQECSLREKENILFMELSEEMAKEIQRVLHKPAEEWAGVRLEPTVVFGIRRYKRGSYFADHVDRNETHIISAIINVAQKVDDDEPWPLDIFDYQGVHHKVVMKPGDLVWYESANLPHGRIKPFQGKYFDNIFVHFAPVAPSSSSGGEEPTKEDNSEFLILRDLP